MNMTGSADVNEIIVRDQCTDIIYPQVEGIKNKEAQERINEVIRRQVDSLVPEGGCEVYQTIMGTYRVELNERGIFSLRLEFYTFPRHAANGSTVVRSVTANLETGEIYRLGDLFRTGGEYRIVLERMIQDQIRERDLPLIDAFPGITDYEEFYLTPGNLVVYYRESLFTPHYVGPPEFSIPYSRIRNLARPGSPIAIAAAQDDSR